MKKHNFTNVLVGLFCACVVTVGLGTSSYGSPKAPAAHEGGNGAGRLTVARSPTLGNGVFVSISVDSNRVASLGMAQKYDGPISAGQHTLSIILDPNLNGQPASKLPLTVVAGQTYGFTATWKGGIVILRRSQ